MSAAPRYPAGGRPAPTRETVRASYESRWSGARAEAVRLIGEGERELSRIVYGVRDKSGWPPTAEIDALDELLTSRLSIYRLRRDLLADKLIEHMAPETDAVIELGAGWGCNLFHLWLRGGPDADYHALELAESGVRTCELIARSAAAAPRIAAAPFDFYHADVSSIAGRYRRPLVFTCAALDKVDPLPGRLIEALLELAPQLTVVHMEFLSWQFSLEQGVREDDAIDHVESSGLNRNLLPMLREAERAGRIVIEEAIPNLLGPHVSYLRWSKRG